MPKGDNPTSKKSAAKKLKVLILQLGARQLRVDQIAKVLDVTERQAYKWIRKLEADGYDVVMRRNPENRSLYYSILQ